MYSLFRGTTVFLTLLFFNSPLFAQKFAEGPKPLIGQGFDIRYLDPLDWHSPTLTTGKSGQVLKVSQGNMHVSSGAQMIKLHNKAVSEVIFVETPYEYEKKVLKSDTLDQIYLSENSRAFQVRALEDPANPIFVFFKYEHPQYAVRLSNKFIPDSLFADRVMRIGNDITVAGFVHQFGTHYAKEVTYGGSYVARHAIVRDEYIYSPYFKEEFQEKVKEFIEHDNKGLPFEEEFLNIRQTNYFSVGGDEASRPFRNWESSVSSNPGAIEVELERLSHLLTSSNFPKIEDIDRKRQLLEAFILEAEKQVKNKMKQEYKGTFFKKFSIPFRQRIMVIEKIESGKESDRVSEFTGDLFFGGYAEDQTLIKLAPVINYGGVRLETLITDEKIEVNKFLDMIVPPEYFKGGYVNVWDESGKMIKGLGRTDLVVTGKPENRTYFKEALRKKVMKKIELRSIDNDLYSVTYSLEHLKVENDIIKPNTVYDYVMDSEIIAAASTGNVDLIHELFKRGANKQAQGLLKAAIISNQSPEAFNILLDYNVVPTTSDLDLAFEVDFFNAEVALILLERGAKPKNNMIFKAVAYREPDVIRALIREGAVPMNNDMDFAIKLKDEEVINALTGRQVKSISNGDVVFEEEPREDGEESNLVLYEVKSGDFLIKIAKKYNVQVNEIKNWNSLSSSSIFVGQKLKIFTTNNDLAVKEIHDEEIKSKTVSLEKETTEIKETLVYTVKSGDYLGKIAEENKVTVRDLRQWNDLNSNKITAGQKLKIRKPKQETPEQVVQNLPQDSVTVSEPTLPATGKDSVTAVTEKEEKVEEPVKEIVQQSVPDPKQDPVQTEVVRPIQETTKAAGDLVVAIESEKEEEVLSRIEKTEKVNDELISTAARKGQAEVVKALLEKGLSPDLAMINTIYYRELPILRILIENGAKLTQKHFNLIIKTNFLEAFKLYVEEGISASVLYTGETSIHQIVQTYTPERLEMLKFLIDKGYHIDIKNQKGETPLHRAVRVGEQNLPVIRLLLENKADVSSQNKVGESIYEAANSPKVKELLEQYKENPNGSSK